jgi:hypothetical protein
MVILKGVEFQKNFVYIMCMTIAVENQTEILTADYDAVWNEVIEEEFGAFPEFFFTRNHKTIDFSGVVQTRAG